MGVPVGHPARPRSQRTSVFTSRTLGDQKTLLVQPQSGFRFKEGPTVVPVDNGITVNGSGGNYTLTIVTAKKQGQAQIQGKIERNPSGGGGGGGTPPERPFDISVLQKWVHIRYTVPSNGTNLIAAVGSTNDLTSVVALGDGSPASGKVNWNAGSLGTLTANDVDLASGSASTKFVAGSSSGTGTITASGQNLTDSGGISVPNTSTNLKVSVAKFDFNQELANPGTTNFIAQGTTVQSGVIELRTKVRISLGTSGIALGTISSSRGSADTFTQDSGSTGSGGYLDTELSTTAKSPSLKAGFSWGGASIQSENHNMLRAVYKNGFTCTIYYTPKESGFTSGGGYNVTLETRDGLNGNTYPHDFLTVVHTEGFGRITTSVNGNNYIAFDGSNWSYASAPLGNRNNTLVAKCSCAVNGGSGTRTIPNTAAIKIISSAVYTTTGVQDWSVADVGGGVAQYQIDLYLGEDNPASSTNMFTPSGASAYAGENNATVTLEGY